MLPTKGLKILQVRLKINIFCGITVAWLEGFQKRNDVVKKKKNFGENNPVNISVYILSGLKTYQ